MDDYEVFYYYLKGENQKPYGCVAIMENPDGTINRGVSLCSKTDAFVKRCARGLAFKRMMDAFKNKTTTTFNRYNEHAINDCNCPVDLNKMEFDTRSAYSVNPTPKEYRILHKPE